MTKAVADEKRARMATGGGKAPKEHFEGDEVFQELLELISLGVHGHDVEFDDDAFTPIAVPDELALSQVQHEVRVEPSSPLFDSNAVEVEFLDVINEENSDDDDGILHGYNEINEPSTSANNKPSTLDINKPSTSAAALALFSNAVEPTPSSVLKIEPSSVHEERDTKVLWNKYSAAMLRKKKNPLLVTQAKRKLTDEEGGKGDDSGVVNLKRTCIQNAIQFAAEKHAQEMAFAKEKHDQEMANLKLTEKELSLSIAKAKVALAEEKVAKRLRLKKLKLELRCEMDGFGNQNVSTDSDTDTTVSDEWAGAVRSDIEDNHEQNI